MFFLLSVQGYDCDLSTVNKRIMFQYLPSLGAKRESKQNATAKYALGKHIHLPDRKGVSSYWLSLLKTIFRGPTST